MPPLIVNIADLSSSIIVIVYYWFAKVSLNPPSIELSPNPSNFNPPGDLELERIVDLYLVYLPLDLPLVYFYSESIFDKLYVFEVIVSSLLSTS